MTTTAARRQLTPRFRHAPARPVVRPQLCLGGRVGPAPQRAPPQRLQQLCVVGGVAGPAAGVRHVRVVVLRPRRKPGRAGCVVGDWGRGRHSVRCSSRRPPLRYRQLKHITGTSRSADRHPFALPPQWCWARSSGTTRAGRALAGARSTLRSVRGAVWLWRARSCGEAHHQPQILRPAAQEPSVSSSRAPLPARRPLGRPQQPDRRAVCAGAAAPGVRDAHGRSMARRLPVSGRRTHYSHIAHVQNFLPRTPTRPHAQQPARLDQTFLDERNDEFRRKRRGQRRLQRRRRRQLQRRRHGAHDVRAGVGARSAVSAAGRDGRGCRCGL